MTRKIINLILLLVVLSFAACGNKSEDAATSGEVVSEKGNYPEAAAAMKKMIKIQEKYVKDIQSVKSADDVVRAVNDYSEAFISISKDLESISSKYPELADDNVSDPEIDALTKRLEELTEKTASESTLKLVKYMSDPKVKQAMEELAQKMGNADF